MLLMLALIACETPSEPRPPEVAAPWYRADPKFPMPTEALVKSQCGLDVAALRPPPPPEQVAAKRSSDTGLAPIEELSPTAQRPKPKAARPEKPSASASSPERRPNKNSAPSGGPGGGAVEGGAVGSKGDSLGGLGSRGQGVGGGGASDAGLGGLGDLGSLRGVGGQGGATTGAPAPAPAPSPASEPVRMADAAAPADAAPPPPMASSPAAEPVAAAESAKAEKKAMPNSGLADGEAEYAERDAIRTRSVPAPDEEARFDWGATTYLSNDDSMSLASAQRLLWTLDRGARPKASEVRPHELLNYFNFDHAEVAQGDTFSVLPSAAQTDGNTLTMGFAIHGYMPERRPLDLTLVLDRSGSMSAEGRMSYLKSGLLTMTDQLQPGDRLDLVLFDSSVCSPLHNFVVGRDDPQLLREVIQAIEPNSATNLNGGLREGYRLARSRSVDPQRNRRLMLITDANLNEGVVNEDLVSEVGKQFDEAGIRLTAIGVGTQFNDSIMDKITEKGRGAYVFLGSEAVVQRVFGPGVRSLVETVAHDVHFALDLPDSLAVERFYGEESSTNKADVKPVNFYAGTTQLFLSEVRVRRSGLVSSDPIVLTMEYKDPETGAPRSQVWRSTVGQMLDSSPRNIQKGLALMSWTDFMLERAMGGDGCANHYASFQARLPGLGDDAELRWLEGKSASLCGTRTTLDQPSMTAVQWKVKFNSDQPIPEVALNCGGKVLRQRPRPGDMVANFSAVQPGQCQLIFEGSVPMITSVEVPVTGGEQRCTLRGGRVSCS